MKKRLRRSTVLVFSVLIVSVLICLAQTEELRPVTVEKQMPDFSLPVFQGGELSLSKFKGKNILLIFPRGRSREDAWCHICNYQYAEWAELEAKLQIREKYNVEILFVLPYRKELVTEWIDKFYDQLQDLEKGKNPPDLDKLDERGKRRMEFYRKAFPKMSEDELFDYAAEVVRNTMHSYSTALPVVRALSRFPLGTYATFPAETLRTGKNIVIKGGQDFYKGMSDLSKGLATGNKDLAKTGFALAQIGSRRLGGAIVAGAGLDYMFGNTDKDDIFGMGVSKEDSEGLDNLLSEWQQNTTKHFNTPIYESRDGNIYTKFVDGGALDTYAFIKDAAKAMYGAVLAGVNPEDTNIKDDFDVEFNKLVSPFISEKALTKRMLEIYQGRDEYGREIDRLDSTSELFTKDLMPGIVKNGMKYFEDLDSEEHRAKNNLPIASSKKGYPVVLEDTVFHNATGIRKQTMNITKAIGHFIYNQQQETKKPYENYIKTLKEFPTKVYTKEDELNLLKAYADSQFEKRRLTKEFADRLNQIKEINYYKKVGDKVYKQKFGMNVIANANAKLGKRKIDKNLLFLLTDKGGAGYFKPDNPIDKKAREIIRDKKLPPEIMNKLTYIRNKFEGSALRKDIDNE